MRTPPRPRSGPRTATARLASSQHRQPSLHQEYSTNLVNYAKLSQAFWIQGTIHTTVLLNQESATGNCA
ncbi:protein of unknown function [Shinella sp. WSC3-e]|nr:hypothetical protein SHINE37_42862 [Rhizobiaceae bacterium]CAK7257431.1 protein of unknown function [Shinella sp. WSC3-e]